MQEPSEDVVHSSSGNGGVSLSTSHPQSAEASTTFSGSVPPPDVDVGVDVDVEAPAATVPEVDAPPVVHPNGDGGGDDDEGVAELGEAGEQWRQERAEDVKGFARSVVSVVVPVTVCIVLVLWAVKAFFGTLQRNGGTALTLVYNEAEGDSGGDKLLGALLNALIMVGAILAMTVILVCLYKLRCMRIIMIWLVGSGLLLLLMFGFSWAYLTILTYRFKFDWITMGFLLYNFGVVGMVSVFWTSSSTFSRSYTVLIGAMVGWWLVRLPEWTTWAFIGLVALYDIVAVLSPKGPLRVLVEESQARNEPLPAVIYKGDRVQLGLGDFIFYSVLCGRASIFDYGVVFACAMGVLMGLCLTLFLLGLFRKALPALPVSVLLGMIFYFVARFFLVDYTFSLTLEHVYL